MMIHFGRIETEAQWKTALVSAGAGLSVVAIAMVVLFAVTRTGR